MTDRKLYEVLGVEPTAAEADIRRAYRKLAKELHPDLNPGKKEAEERFKKVASAYEIIGDAEKRGRYDRGEIDAEGAETAPREFYRQHADANTDHAYSSGAGFEDFGDFSDLFAQAARARRQARPADMRGSDAVYNMDVDFLDAANGATRRVTMPDGAVLDVKIPAGVETGQVLRLKGKGAPGHGKGPPGDALVIVEVRPHPRFTRTGDDVTLDLPVAINEAVLGARVEVPTLDGHVRMTLPKGTQNGQILRLRSKGFRRGQSAGDLLVRARIVMPAAVDGDLTAFFERWQKDHAYDPRSDMEHQT